MILRTILAAAALLASTTAAVAQSKLDFARDVRPILANHCWTCHGFDEEARAAELRLDVRDAAIAPLNNGHRAIVPGNSKDSAVVARLYHDKPSRRMPPPDFKKPVTDQQREILKRWIDEGATYTQHWAFIKPKRPELPAVKNRQWPINPIDFFILDRLEREGLSPSPPASKETLLRRAALDLTGLPPTLDDLNRFLKDDSPNAYEKAVDRLLASPRYAEKMAVSWLDLARYADTNGYNNDDERTMWPWRDWVLRAFDKNMPYDQFLVEQLAGDLLPNATLDQKIATGFNRNHGFTTEGGIIVEEYRVEYISDRVHTASTAALALSFQCARCHEHKYDPISQKEYYEFYAFFNNIEDRLVPFSQRTASAPFLMYTPPEIAEKLAANEKRLAAAEKRFVELQRGAAKEFSRFLVELRIHDPTAKQFSPKVEDEMRKLKAEYPKARDERNDARRTKVELEKGIVQAMVMEEQPKRRETFILKRGQYDQPADKVSANVPAFLPPLPNDAPRDRLALAKWLVDPNNPLTARVAVNRWWASIFGAGIVETVEDFGLQGDLPSHPELLDWLATELVRTGWDVKAMHKLIVTSQTYRQSAKITPEHLAKDPKNRLLAHSPRFRLPAETVRDNALAVSGLLKEKLGGPSVKPYQPAGLWEDVSVERRYKYVADKGDDLYRRGLYTFWRRTIAPPGMTTFDAPNREYCVPRRSRTNTPLQALILQNDPTYVEASRIFAEQMMKADAAIDARLSVGYRLALSREPTSAEKVILIEMLNDSRQRYRKNPEAAAKLLSIGDRPRDASLEVVELAAWTAVANTILNLDETISRP